MTTTVKCSHLCWFELRLHKTRSICLSSKSGQQAVAKNSPARFAGWLAGYGRSDNKWLYLKMHYWGQASREWRITLWIPTSRLVKHLICYLLSNANVIHNGRRWLQIRNDYIAGNYSIVSTARGLAFVFALVLTLVFEFAFFLLGCCVFVAAFLLNASKANSSTLIIDIISLSEYK